MVKPITPLIEMHSVNEDRIVRLLLIPKRKEGLLFIVEKTDLNSTYYYQQMITYTEIRPYGEIRPSETVPYFLLYSFLLKIRTSKELDLKEIEIEIITVVLRFIIRLAWIFGEGGEEASILEKDINIKWPVLEESTVHSLDPVERKRTGLQYLIEYKNSIKNELKEKYNIILR